MLSIKETFVKSLVHRKPIALQAPVVDNSLLCAVQEYLFDFLISFAFCIKRISHLQFGFDSTPFDLNLDEFKRSTTKNEQNEHVHCFIMSSDVVARVRWKLLINRRRF
jgi:hypothetical protein